MAEVILRPGAWRECAREVWIPTATEMAAFDRWAVESGATVERALIESAGRELAHRVCRHVPDGVVSAVAGSGHNGADALVAARTLAAWGRDVRLFRAGRSAPEPDVLAGWEIPLEPGDALFETPPVDGVLLDGILGTGLKGPPRQAASRLIERINALSLPVIAVDGPSGADLDSGDVPGACIRADLTVTFGWPKLGLLRFPARAQAGVIETVEIGFPPGEEEFGARAITGRWVRELLGDREANAHKGRAGYVAVVAGRSGMAGAATLAVRAAMRGGAGIVRVLSDPANREILQTAAPGAVFGAWDDPEVVADTVDWCDALAIGPGLGREPGAKALVEEILARRADRPVVLDADGISIWEGESARLARLLGPHDVLTPHPGELARLTGRDATTIAADAPAFAASVARDLDSTVVLKGAPTFVSSGRKPLLVATTGGSALASGGTGDVLTGLIAAYLAAGLSGPDAAAAALFVSGLAAELAVYPTGHGASDVPDRIPIVRQVLSGLPSAGSGSVLFASADAARPGGGLGS